MVGEFDGEVHLAHGNPHARFNVDAGGKDYEADINVRSTSNPSGTPDGSDVEYAETDQVVNSEPTDGVTVGGHFSYDQQGLTESDFHKVDDNSLHKELENLASHSDKIELAGKMYHDPGKDGIHDIHMNSGEPAGSGFGNDPGHDGYAAFYTRGSDGKIHKESVFIKFQGQQLNQSV